jgi:hypothetical protein
VKQLGSLWVVAALLGPVLITISMLACSGGGSSSSQAATTNKGSVQLSFTGSISSNSGLDFQSLLLNVIAVRLNPSTDPTVPDSDPNWQTISAPAGTAAGQSFPTLTSGGNFGPNGNAVTVGQAEGEIQIDLAQLQNTVVQFNTGSIKAEIYGQIELLLDSRTPGVVVPQCASNTSAGEGCVTYPLQLASDVSSIRVVSPLTVTRNATQALMLDIGVELGAAPASSISTVLFTPSICAVPGSGPSTCPASPFTPLTQDEISAVVTDSVSGSPTAKTIVNAELTGTSTIVASAPVFKTNNVWTYTMVLPAPTAGASPALYDLFTSTSGRTQDPHSSIAVSAGTYSSPISSPSPDPFHFNIIVKGSKTVSGTVVDACTGSVIPAATLQLYVPPTLYESGGVLNDCTATPVPAACPTTCGVFGNFPNNQDVQPGCVIVGVTSTDDTGSYPLPGSSTQVSPFKVIPLPASGVDYGLTAQASGYNGEALGVSQKNGILECPGSGFSQSSGFFPCNFSLQRGQIDVTTDIGPSPAVTPSIPLNLLVEAEDHGTFTGEGVTSVTIPAGQSSNPVAVPLLVPINPPTPAVNAAPTASPTPVIFGGAPSYDLFASVQDLFGASPQKVSGHEIAVLGAVAAPTLCGTTTAPTLTGLACVGHGSAPGTINNADANTLVVLSKLDPNGNDVDIQSNQVPLVAPGAGASNYAICAPADLSPYTVTHYEAAPGETPSPVASTSVTLTGPIILNSPVVTSTPTPVPCIGICSDFGQSSNGKSCYLCQTSPNLPAL